jgi:hypothetical protein
MSKRILTLIAVLVVAALALPLVVSAQEETRAFTITEEEINRSFHVTNPARRGVTEVRVNLQPDQVSMLSYTLTRRAPRGQQTTTYSVNTVFVPNVRDGRLYWTITRVSVNGQAASDDLIRQINASIESSWRNYIRRQLGTGHVNAVTITDTDMTITLN